ncbi:NHL repeat-containing protein 2 [Gryllus bimaculatus]|nr:NHL repeat-containing protein 2 [Gryllus bimaculatus]
MSAVLENVMERSLILIDNLRNANEEKSREKLLSEYLAQENSKVDIGDFKEGLEWFNVTKPLSIHKELKGKLVILDFFTYCCINCLHILPKMKKIEEEHTVEKGVVVVGVHSAKFDNEKDSSNIMSALQRYNISHPVVNDAEATMWSALGIPCWPTLLVLSTAGFCDGDFATAKFFSPQGLAFVDFDTLYVADTENNAIRKIDFVSQKVNTVLTNQKAENGTENVLSSPWDICSLPDGSCLLIAAAGSHQLWGLFLRDTLWWRNTHMPAGTCVPVAGTGREENRNNVYPHAAAFAQPSGVCVAPTLNAVFVADSESSSVRRVDLKDGRVSAVVGGGRSPTDLFCFGDVDGRQWDVKLQHPLGVAWSTVEGGALYVVDSYNHKLKKVLPEERTCHTVLGIGVAGDSVKQLAEQLNEPGGLCASPCGSLLYIADTNNNCIKVVQLHASESTPISLHKLNVKLTNTSASLLAPEIAKEVSVCVSPSGGEICWRVGVELPEGFALTCGAPQRWALQVPSASGWVGEPANGQLSSGLAQGMVKVPPGSSASIQQVLFVATLFTCDNANTCQRQSTCVALNVKYEEGASKQVECSILHKVQMKKAH